MSRSDQGDVPALPSAYVTLRNLRDTDKMSTSGVSDLQDGITRVR